MCQFRGTVYPKLTAPLVTFSYTPVTSIDAGEEVDSGQQTARVHNDFRTARFTSILFKSIVVFAATWVQQDSDFNSVVC